MVPRFIPKARGTRDSSTVSNIILPSSVFHYMGQQATTILWRRGTSFSRKALSSAQPLLSIELTYIMDIHIPLPLYFFSRAFCLPPLCYLYRRLLDEGHEGRTASRLQTTSSSHMNVLNHSMFVSLTLRLNWIPSYEGSCLKH